MFRTIFNADDKLWSGVAQPSLYNPKISLGHVLLRAMKSNPTKIAQVRTLRIFVEFFALSRSTPFNSLNVIKLPKFID